MRGDVKIFASKISCLTEPKNFVGQTFTVSLVPRIEKNYASGGYMSQFSVEFFCLTVPKNFVREPFFALFQKIPVAKLFMDEKTRSIKTFRRNILVSQCRKLS